jgi:hypothetical protein
MEGLMPQAQKSIVSINEPYQRAARKTLGDLSKASVRELIELYYACEAADERWGALEMKGRAERVAIHELDRVFYMQEVIIAEMQKRPPGDREEVKRISAMLSWFDKSGADDAGLYADVLKSVNALSPALNRSATT